MRNDWLVMPAWLCILQSSLCIGYGQPPEPSTAETPAPAHLRTIADCLGQVEGGVPPRADVLLDATVTLVDRSLNLIVLQDGTGAMAAHVPASVSSVTPGQRVIVEGSHLLPYARVFPTYPDHPSHRGVLSSLEAPSGRGTYYLTRIRGYVHPPASGQFRFWIAADDASELHLSPDVNPDRMQRIAGNGVGNATRGQDWERYASQRSQWVTLEAGRSYYIEALHVQSYGQDCLAVAWEGPGIERSVIEGQYLTPWAGGFNAESPGATSVTPTNGVLWESWTNCFVRGFEALREWKRNDAIVGIRGPKFTVTGDELWPLPRRIDRDTGLGAVPNLHWVELEGDVTFAGGSGSELQFELKKEDSKLEVRILDRQGMPAERLANARIRVRGVLLHAYSLKGELVSTTLWVPDSRQVSLLASREFGPDYMNRVPICEINPANPEMRWGRRVSVLGRIHSQDTNGFMWVQGADEYQAFGSADGTEWVSLGTPVEVQMDRGGLAGLAVVSRHDSQTATASFDPLRGLGTNWIDAEIGNPGQKGRFDVQDERVSLTGSGRQIGERGDQLYFVHQPLDEDAEISTRLMDLQHRNSRAQAGIMVRESLAPGAAFAAVLFSPVSGPVVQYRQTAGDRTRSLETNPDHNQFRWMKLVKRKSLLRVQSGQDSALVTNEQVELTGTITWQDRIPILIDPFVRSAPVESPPPDQRRRPPQLSIASFVAEARNPLDLDLSRRMEISDLHGIVTFCGEFLGQVAMFIQDENQGGLRVAWADSQVRPDFEVGQLVQVSGSAAVREFPVILESSEVKTSGWGSLPEPEQFSPALIETGSGQALWVEAAGVFRSADSNGVLRMMTSDGLLDVWMCPQPGVKPGHHEDALVRLRGVLSMNASHRAILLVPSPGFVEVIEDPPTDLFAIPGFSVAALTGLPIKPERLRRMKLGGVVTCSLPTGVYLQDETGGAFVETATLESVHPGDRIEAVGFPEGDSAALLLKEARVRRIGTDELPSPVRIGPDEDLHAGQLAGTLITLEATLLEQLTTREGQRLTLQKGTRVFEATGLFAPHDRLPQLDVGSRVSVCGVLQTASSVLSRPDSPVAAMPVGIHLRSPADVVVLERPPWWTLGRAAVAGGMFAGGLLGALIWVRVLRQRVAQRTTELNATMQRLETETRASAVLAERDRLAGEIHDSLEQGLTAIMLQLDAASKRTGDIPETQRHLQVARSMAEFSRAEVQHAVWDIQSPLLANADLGTALKHVADCISTGVPRVIVDVIGNPRPLPSSHGHHLLRIAQEAMTNSIKHAAARTITVTLDHSAPGLTLTIADDGRGFIPGEVQRQGATGRFGLHGMRARAKKIGAVLDIATGNNRGTIITVRLPPQDSQAGPPSRQREPR